MIKLRKLLLAIFTIIALVITFGTFISTIDVQAETTYTESEFGEGKFIITTTYNSTTKYYLPTTTTSSAPKASTFTDCKSISDQVWTITKAENEGEYYIQNSDGKYLYITNASNGVRVGTTKDTWKYDKTNNALQAQTNKRYLGVYNDADWRSYATCGATNYKKSGTSFVFYKVSSSDPSISITSTDSNLLINETTTLVANVTNFGDVTPTYTWTSSDETIATVTSSGLVTALKMGSTTITVKASYEDIEYSDTLTLKVYPSNTSAITIAQALEIAELAGNTNSPYKYTTSGTIESTDTSSFVLKDDTGSITVFKSKHGVSAEQAVEVNGYLVNYKDTTLEFSNPDLIWTVTFNSNGGNRTPDVQKVVGGKTASEPLIDIEKDGYELSGWYLNNTEYDFSSAVNSNITLTAKWIESASALAKNNLDKVNQYVSLGYKYNANVAEGSGNFVKLTSLLNVNAGDEIIIVSKYGDKYYALTSEITNNASTPLDITSLIDANNAITTIDASAVWTLGGSIGAYTLLNGENYIVVSKGDLSTNTDSTKASTFALTINGENSYLGTSDRLLKYRETIKSTTTDGVTTTTTTQVFKNYSVSSTGSDYASETFIYVKEKTATTYTDVDFRIRVGIDSTIDTYENGYASEYGIEVKTADKTVKYAYTNTLIQKDDSISYVIIDLGDLIANPSRFDTKFTICAFATIDGTTYYSQCVRVFSVKDLVKEYSNQETTKAQVEGLKTLLQKLGYTFE